MQDKNDNDSKEAIFELIQNIQSKLNTEENVQNETPKSDQNNIDFSKIMSMFGNTNSDDKTSGLDMGSILKFQKLFSAVNKNDPKRNLLISLKPFLRKSRQDKLNEYITMLTIGDALGIFGSRGENNDK